MSDLDAEFKDLTRHVDHPPLLRSLWEQAEVDVRGSDGVPTFEAIGWRTWSKFASDDERAEGLGEMFHAYGKTLQHDAEQAAMEPVHAEILDLLKAHRVAARLGKPISPELTHQITVLADIWFGGDL